MLKDSAELTLLRSELKHVERRTVHIYIIHIDLTYFLGLQISIELLCNVIAMKHITPGVAV